MPGDVCAVCGNTRAKDKHVSMHRFPPTSSPKRSVWLEAFGLSESDIKSHTRVCSRHFKDGNPQNPPQLTLG